MEKIYKVIKNGKIVEMTHSAVSKLLLTPGFMSIFNDLKVGERMFNNDLMVEFERIK